MSLAQKKPWFQRRRDFQPDFVICSCADRTTGWREPTRWLPKCVFNACVCVGKRVAGSFSVALQEETAVALCGFLSVPLTCRGSSNSREVSR